MSVTLPSRARAVVEFDPLRDARHRNARSARDQADWLTWLELGGLRPRTLDDYERATAVCLRMFPSKTFAELTDGDLVHVFKTFPAASRRIRVAAYRSWFKWGMQTRRLERNPMDMLPTIRRAPQKYIEVFTDAEVAALESLPSPDGPLMAILLRAGLRKGEARRLKERHCDLVKQRIIILDGKGGRDRVVPMGDELARILNELFILEGLARDDYLWYSRPGGGRVQRNRVIGEGSFARWWADCCDRADVTYIPRRAKDGGTARGNPHVTRHTFATRWLQRGGRLETLSRAMGHASIRTTFDLYGHLVTDDIAADLALVEADR